MVSGPHVLGVGRRLCGLQDRALEAPGARCPFLLLSYWDTHWELHEDDQVITAHLFFPIDVNECSYEELNACSERELCLNVEGSYQCVRRLGAPTLTPQRLNRTCEGKRHRTRVRNLIRLAGP